MRTIFPLTVGIVVALCTGLPLAAPKDAAAEIEKTNSAYRKDLGDWRKYLADELTKESHKKGAVDEVLKEKASVEYRLALKGYQESARLKPADMDVQQAIRELSKLEVR